MRDDDNKLTPEEYTQKQIKRVVSIYSDLLNVRSPWEKTWKELAKMFNSTGYRDDDTYDESTKERDVINREIIDTAGVDATTTLASGMQGGMTSPARPWFALRIQGFLGESNHEEKTYLDEVAERMRQIFHISNFYNASYQVYTQIGVFGISLIYEDADFDGFRFITIPTGTYVVDVDYRGKVDTAIRKIWLSWKQIEQQFGEDMLPDDVKLFKGNKKRYATEKHAVFHAVVPNDPKNVREGSLNHKHRKFLSYYYMDRKNPNGQYVILRESGYDSMPFFCVRWEVEAGDTYGKSPALNCLGNNKLLQKVVEDTAEGIHKQVNPPVNAPSSMMSSGVDLSAGAVNFFEQTAGVTQVGVIPTMQVQVNVQNAMMYSQQLENKIKVSMYNDLFRMLIDSNRRQITAMEVASKEEEKLILIGPVLERLQSEFFIPLIERTYELMEKLDMLPPVPESMRGQSIKVEFVSTLAQAQKIVATGSLQQLSAFIGNIAQMKPEALDNFDADEVIRLYAEYLGTEASALKPIADVIKVRQGRAQAEQQMQAQQQMAMTAQTAQAMGNTPVNVEGAPNALDALLGGLGSI